VPLLLEAVDLNLLRGNALLFSGVSLQAHAGEAWLVRGANGCGKTSLLRLLAGLTQAESGTVLRHSALLYVGHANALKDDLTVDENLDYSLRADGLAVDALTRAQALRHVGLHTKRNLLAKRLSQGQKRRVGLARLQLASQKIWLLDEPTNALDDEGVKLFEAAIGGHLQAGGTAIIATHLPLDLAQYASAVQTLKLSSGTPS
jgi:heme exporter protein A